MKILSWFIFLDISLFTIRNGLPFYIGFVKQQLWLPFSFTREDVQDWFHMQGVTCVFSLWIITVDFLLSMDIVVRFLEILLEFFFYT